ncbi:MAG TPA: F-box associated domain-containing protein [Gaiellaceae bacterium]
MLRLIPLIALVALLAACGPPGPKTYSELKSRACFTAAGQRTTAPPATDFVASTALGGAFRVHLTKNFVTISFGKDQANAQNLDDVYRSVHSKNVGIDDVLRMDGNAVMLWHAHPTDNQLNTVSHCLKT